MSNGIKQGGILSPRLFNIYVDTLSVTLNRQMIGCCFNGCKINHLHYADDLVLISPSSLGMQKLINVCERFACTHEMKFNDSKSVLLLFRPVGIKISPNMHVYMNDKLLKVDVKCRYLGHIMCNDLKDNEDIKRQLRSFYGKSNMVLRTFGKCSYSVKLKLFTSYFGCLYTMFLWCVYKKQIYRQMEVAYNNVFRRLFDYDKFCSARTMFVENRIDHFEARKRHMVYSFQNRLSLSNNYLVESIVSSSAWLKSVLNKMWLKILFV